MALGKAKPLTPRGSLQEKLQLQRPDMRATRASICVAWPAEFSFYPRASRTEKETRCNGVVDHRRQRPHSTPRATSGGVTPEPHLFSYLLRLIPPNNPLHFRLQLPEDFRGDLSEVPPVMHSDPSHPLC